MFLCYTPTRDLSRSSALLAGGLFFFCRVLLHRISLGCFESTSASPLAQVSENRALACQLIQHTWEDILRHLKIAFHKLIMTETSDLRAMPTVRLWVPRSTDDGGKGGKFVCGKHCPPLASFYHD